MFASQLNIDPKFVKRREVVFMILSGIFLGSLAILNIVGITRFIDLSFTIGSIKIPFVVAVGVLAYPITFLCTDFISELYGKRRANLLVWVGLLINVWLLFLLWLGGELPPEPVINEVTGLPEVGAHGRVFFELRKLAFTATAASMIAYLTAQYCDVQIFHYLKKLTNGKHLWLRNNGSTLISQLVDSIAVILITYFFNENALPIEEGDNIVSSLVILILSGYVFKLVAALIDTIPFYIGTHFLTNYLGLQEVEEVD